jgi:hypothetical protein
MFKNILILTTIYLIGFVVSSNAQEKQCWRGTVEVESKIDYEESKKKQDASGHGIDIFKTKIDIRLKINFYIEPGKKDVILGKEISGSYNNESKDEWQSKYAYCLKRVVPGKMPREVRVSPGNSHDKKIIETANLCEDKFTFDIDVSMDSKTKTYSLDLHISGLKWIGSHEQKKTFNTIDRKTCKKKKPFEEDIGPINLEKPIMSSLGGDYKGYAVTANTIIGSKTTKSPTGELLEDNEHTKKLEAMFMDSPYETTYSWELHRVVWGIFKVV